MRLAIQEDLPENLKFKCCRSKHYNDPNLYAPSIILYAKTNNTINKDRSIYLCEDCSTDVGWTHWYTIASVGLKPEIIQFANMTQQEYLAMISSITQATIAPYILTEDFNLVPEFSLKLANGNYLVCESSDGNPAGTSYVKVINSNGVEVGYWTASEWAVDPELVMGAIFGCAANG